MPITIASNIASLGAQRQLGKVTESLGNTFERLSSGMRINKASDDAAGLAIASSLRADARVFTKGIQNLSDGISIFSIASESLSNLSGIVQRQAELAEQSANGTFNYKQRQSMQQEINALTNEYNRIVATTKFNGIKIIDGTLNTSLQAGYGSSGSLQISTDKTLTQTVSSGIFNTSSASGAFTTYSGLASGDFNNDGIVDLVLAGSDINPNTTIMLGNGDGTFTLSNSYSTGVSFGGSGNASQPTVADLDGDGNLDIVALNRPDGKFVVMYGDGKGSFGNFVTYSVADTASGNVSVGDMNGDGVQDIFYGGAIFSSQSSRSYSSYNLGNVSSYAGNAMADLNGDGILDVVGAPLDQLNISLGNGNGTFKATTTITTGSGSEYHNSIQLVDINNDGRIDILVNNYKSGGLGDSFSAYIGNGDGTFKVGVSYQTTSNGPYQMTTSDLNKDGIKDVIVAGIDGSLNVHFGNADGSFSAGLSQSTIAGTFGVTVGDFNSDQVDDVVTLSTNPYFNQLTIATSQTTTNTSSTLSAYNILNQASARSALNYYSSHVEQIALQIGKIGSALSRIDTAVNNLRSSTINYQAAQARIMDVDVAEESASLTQKNILQQAASSVLAQANQQPQLALQLLRG